MNRSDLIRKSRSFALGALPVVALSVLALAAKADPPALPVPTLVEEPAEAEPAFDSRPEAIVTKPDAKKSAAKPVESAQRPPVRPAVKPPTERDMRSPVWTR